MSSIVTKGDTEVYSGRSIRLEDGSRIECTGPYIYDCFAHATGALGSAVPQTWTATQAGSGTLYVGDATTHPGVIGISGGTTDNAVELAGTRVCWKPSTMGPIIWEAKASFDGATTPADGDFYFGLSDAVTEASSLPYVISAASALTTSAPSDFVGFCYTSLATSGALYAASGNNYIGLLTTKANVDTITATTKVKDSSLHTYRIEVEAAGHARFYYDGTHVGTVASATTAATALTPYLCAVAKASHAHTASVRSIGIWATGA